MTPVIRGLLLRIREPAGELLRHRLEVERQGDRVIAGLGRLLGARHGHLADFGRLSTPGGHEHRPARTRGGTFERGQQGIGDRRSGAWGQAARGEARDQEVGEALGVAELAAGMLREQPGGVAPPPTRRIRNPTGGIDIFRGEMGVGHGPILIWDRPLPRQRPAYAACCPLNTRNILASAVVCKLSPDVRYIFANITAFTIIHDRSEMLCLTDMWRAQGSDPARKPIEWLDSADGKRFCETVAEVLNPLKSFKVGNSHFEENQLVTTKKGGNNAGTWAHWQIGLAYAKYLSPEFHMWCNTVVRQHMEGGATAIAVPDADALVSAIAAKVIEVMGEPVVTFAMVDAVHKRPKGTARRTFNENRARFMEAEDFVKVCADEIRSHKVMPLSPKAHEDVTFLTRRGYLKLVKPMGDDRAWEVQGDRARCESYCGIFPQ